MLGACVYVIYVHIREPEPLSPTSATTCPGSMQNEILLSTCVSGREGYTSDTCSKAMRPTNPRPPAPSTRLPPSHLFPCGLLPPSSVTDAASVCMCVCVCMCMCVCVCVCVSVYVCVCVYALPSHMQTRAMYTRCTVRDIACYSICTRFGAATHLDTLYPRLPIDTKYIKYCLI